MSLNTLYFVAGVEGVFGQAMGRLEFCYAFHLVHPTQFDLQISYQFSRL